MHEKRVTISIAAIAVWFLVGANAVAADEAQSLSVVTGGKSAYVIVVPDDADAGRIAKASGLLQRVIAEATGVQLPVVKESALAVGTPAIYLGKSEAARRAGLDVDKAQGWAYLHRVAGRDIFLVGDQLLVAHEASQNQPERTLEALYLKPLLERVRLRGGYVQSPDTRFHLLIDIKSEALITYQALDRALQHYSEILTRFETNQIATNAVTITISGNRPREFLEQQSPRFAAYDGRLADLDSDAPPQLIPLISDNWQSHFQWRGEGPLPGPERMKLRELVRRAHDQGRAIRFWANPDRPEGWAALRDAGVDLINTDDLTGLRDFLLRPQSH